MNNADNITKKDGVYYMRLLQGYSERDDDYEDRIQNKIKWIEKDFKFLKRKKYGFETCLTYII